jgi:hypothetical protein
MSSAARELWVPGHIRPNAEGWAFARKTFKLRKDVDLAKFVEMSESTLWRVLKAGDQIPGESFINNTLRAFYHPDTDQPSFDFHDLFEGDWK